VENVRVRDTHQNEEVLIRQALLAAPLEVANYQISTFSDMFRKLNKATSPRVPVLQSIPLRFQA